MTEEQIIAYVDGELGQIEARRFERAVEADSALAAEVERHRRLRAAIATHFASVTEEPVPDRLAALFGQVDTVIPFPARRGGDSGRRGRYAALAATLVAGLVAGHLLPMGTTAPIGQQGERMVAQGDLAAALDSQLASAPQRAPYRIGVSFVGIDGRYCRTFRGGAGAGIGCRGDAGWTLERFAAAVAPAARGAYRQVGTPEGEIMAAAQDMMAGAPLDGAAEARARDRGWRAAER